MNTLITIDPGWSGAVAFFEKGNLQFTTNCPTSRDATDMMKVIRNAIGRKRPTVYIERVWARPFERGAFTLNDTIATVAYAKDLSYSFILISIAAVLFQPFFTLPSSDVSKFSMKFAGFFIVAIITILIYFIIRNSTIMI